MKTTLFFLLFTFFSYHLSAQFVDLSYPFQERQSGSFKAGVGYKMKLRAQRLTQLKVNYESLNSRFSPEFITASIGFGNQWSLNTAMPMEVTPVLSVGYFNSLAGRDFTGIFYALEVDYHHEFFGKFSLPVGFQRYAGREFVLNQFLIGIRFHPFRT